MSDEIKDKDGEIDMKPFIESFIFVIGFWFVFCVLALCIVWINR